MMGILELIYIVGCVIAFILCLWTFFKLNDEDVTVGDLCTVLFISLMFSLGSWMTIFIMAIIRYEDRVIIKHKKQ